MTSGGKSNETKSYNHTAGFVCAYVSGYCHAIFQFSHHLLSNALFAFITLIMLLPFIILFCRAITLQDQLAIAMHHPTDTSDPTAVHQPVLSDVCILDV
jgi:hypothetical protein